MTTEKVCTDCNISLPLTSFRKQDDKWYRNACKNCAFKHFNENINSTPKTYLQHMLKRAMGNSQQRSLLGRTDAGKCSIVIEHLLKLHEEQKGLCYYSKIPYVLNMGVDFQCSLERLDPTKGYVPDNITLVILELNGVNQWSVEKFDLFKKLLNRKHDKQNIDFSVPTVKKRTRGRRIQQVKVGDIDCVICSKCNKTKPATDFFKVRGNGCSDCRSRIAQEYNDTPRGHLQQLIRSMKKSTKKRNEKGRQHQESEFTFDKLTNLWETQTGLCAYSRLPMTFGSYRDKNWTCSAERIDSTKGYIEGNVCLICHEFNTGHHVQWSKEKIEIIRTT